MEFDTNAEEPAGPSLAQQLEMTANVGTDSNSNQAGIAETLANNNSNSQLQSTGTQDSQTSSALKQRRKPLPKAPPIGALGGEPEAFETLVQKSNRHH